MNKPISPAAALEILDGDDDGVTAAVAAYLTAGAQEWDNYGDAAGVTYRDDATGSRYEASVSECRLLLAIIADRIPGPYSAWCSETTPREVFG